MNIETILKNIFFAVLLMGLSAILTSLYWKSKITASLSQTPSPQKVAQTAVDFLNQNLLRDKKASLVSAEEESGLFRVKIKIEEREYTVFVTKDGKILFPEEGIRLDKPLSFQPSQNPPPKRDRVDVKLFVMSYCPFGLQMQKAILPVWELLKGKADFGVYFVDYIMHGKEEMEENLRQYCIQKEEKDKYLAYLACFLKKGSYENVEIYKECLKETNIDENKLKFCQEKIDKEFKISENFKEDGYPPFNVHHDLNRQYGVRGSPTLVVNDTIVEPKRSPEAIKEIICQSFTQPPKECEQKLSDEVASAGFGEKGSTSVGACQ